MIIREVQIFRDTFERAQTLTTTPGQNGWTTTQTKTNGSPTATVVNGGTLQLALTNTSEIQVQAVHTNDVLPFDATQIQSVDFIVSASGVGAATTLAFGLATAHNNALASLTNCVLFVVNGATSTSSIVLTATDGTNTQTNQSTGGSTLGSTPIKCSIDFTNGLADVRFLIDGQPIATAAPFDLTAFVAGTNYLQLYMQVQKTAAADAPTLSVNEVRVQYKRVLGS